MNNKSIRKLFNRFSISHGYRSSYTINQFQSNLDYNPGQLEQKINMEITYQIYFLGILIW